MFRSAETPLDTTLYDVPLQPCPAAHMSGRRRPAVAPKQCHVPRFALRCVMTACFPTQALLEDSRVGQDVFRLAGLDPAKVEEAIKVWGQNFPLYPCTLHGNVAREVAILQLFWATTCLHKPPVD